MNSPKLAPNDPIVPFWVTQQASQLAEEFASQQPTPYRAQQVYQNTLAVWVVNNYLKLLGIATDLGASDSWNPVLRLTHNVADLVVVNRGRLDCRPVSPGAETCFIPLEAQSDRIGYVIVRLDSDQTATLLGFVDQISSDLLSLQELRPMVELPVHLARQSPITDLRQWLEGIYQQDWHPPEQLLRPKQLVLGHSRGYIQRAKHIELNLNSEHRDVVLLVAVAPQDQALSVRVQLHPAIVAEGYSSGTRLIQASLDCLAPNLQLSLITDQQGEQIQVTARNYPRDNCIQLPPFQGQMGERFVLRIRYGEQTIEAPFQL